MFCLADLTSIIISDSGYVSEPLEANLVNLDEDVA